MELPVAGEGLHYLDNAATTFPKPESVLQLAVKFCASACVNPGRSTYDLAMEAEEMLRFARQKLCDLFGGTDPSRLVFGYNATDALNLAIFGLLRGGGHVISTRLEHNSVLRPIAHCEDDYGVESTLVPFDGDGYLDPEDIRKALRSDTKLCVVNHGSNVLGTVQPIAEVGAICREAGVPLCIDAAQSAGVIPIDMTAMHVDVVAFTGHKSLLGPMGIGGLCVGEDVEIGHSRAGGTGVKSAQRRHLDEFPFRLEYGTPNMMGIAGLSNGVDYILSQGGVEKIHAQEMKLARILWEGLREPPNVTVYCAETIDRPRTPVFSFNIEGMDPAQVGTRLDVDFDVACRTGLHCAPLVHETVGTSPEGAVRLSIGPLTTEEDVRAGVAAVQELAAEAKRA
ncbi:MAG: aminotransferase class V-fold PLP-dependent enzyme [Deltaproteobacteria bacterium]|jgi:cysteine desulfurase family protein|nr:aminotransferase class V-fold PLP-dependent enzyme [Deltaproteobacteria bacterium]MBW2534140.1 aminotransferase class V-fold PLP-dependent enzyme [Deltaproteobacteria bacterium]